MKNNIHNIMNYSGYGFIGFALLIGMAFCIFSSRNIESQEFVRTLDKKQLDIYKSIVEFRFNLWLQGLVLGLIIAVIVCMYISSYFNNYGCALLFTAILLFVNYMFYSMYPKPAWMLDYTKNLKQVKEWLDVYQFMKNRYHLGILCGIVAFFLLSYAYFEYKTYHG
jgi:uncharacterized protein YacL